ncbi:MAG: PepSY-associated TM helix domain-containing protein [Vicinamibacterales bacterium]
MKRFRHACLVWHRYAGLFMALFLAVAGLTGSILAFRDQIDRMLDPHLHARALPGATRVPLIEIAQRMKNRVPHAAVAMITRDDDAVTVGFQAERNPETGKRYALPIRSLAVNPWTGEEMGAAESVRFTTYVLKLHDRLFGGSPGYLFMGLVALVWTVDCFVAFYLTMPLFRRGFWRQWKPAWLIKRNAGTYRLNLDLHRAFGLWLWPMLFVFAWSSVAFNLRFPVYEFVMKHTVGYDSQISALMTLAEQRGKEPPVDDAPAVDWARAEATGRALVEARGRQQGFSVGDTLMAGDIPQLRAYTVGVLTSEMVGNKPAGALTMFEADGTPLLVMVYSGGTLGNTIETWFSALHTTKGFGLWYQVFVACLGMVIAMFSVTGVYLWWTKRAVRTRHKGQPTNATADAVA